MKPAKTETCKRSQTKFKVAVLGAVGCSLLFGAISFKPHLFLPSAKESAKGPLYIDLSKTNFAEKVVLNTFFSSKGFKEIDNRKIVETRKTYAHFLQEIESCKNAKNNKPESIQTLAQFVNLAKQIDDDRLMLSIVNGFVNSKITYDTQKSEKTNSVYEKEKSDWYQSPYDTITSGKGICTDYVILKDALLLAIKGEDWHKNNTAMLSLALTKNKNDAIPRLADNARGHIINLVTVKDKTYALDLFGTTNTEGESNAKLPSIKNGRTWDQEYLASCEIGTLEEDHLNQSTRSDRTYQLNAKHYPDNAYKEYSPILSSNRGNWDILTIPSTEIIFSAGSDPSMKERTKELFTKAAQNEKTKNILAQIKNLSASSIEAHKYSSRPHLETKIALPQYTSMTKDSLAR